MSSTSRSLLDPSDGRANAQYGRSINSLFGLAVTITLTHAGAMARSRLVRSITLTLSNALLPIAVLIFASGFFPYRPFLPGLAAFEDVQEFVGREQPDAPFDRVVFMVVDALRSDFVYGHGTGFEFTQSLIRSGAAVPFTAHATPPTVTMPRVKALTTGSVPSFLDLILNFAESDTTSSLATQDTWLAQLRAKGHGGGDKNSNGKLVFYGDDTWLKLFPGDFFARADGTSSFFVSDFTEVDLNVTRHVPHELARDDWSAMIMHYLGLDHIGHKTGPQGPNMLPKQKEMDEIVRNVYEAMETRPYHRNTLLVLAGDHGMNAGGNHGGSGPGETEPALLFASPKFQQMRERHTYDSPTVPKDGTEFHFYAKIEQNDVVPTLAALMSFPVPRNSLGVCIPQLMGFWDATHRAQLLRQNAKQILRIVTSAFGEESFAASLEKFKAREPSSLAAACQDAAEGEEELACKWALAEGRGEDDDAAVSALHDFLAAAQESMSSTASSYDIPRMAAGMAISLTGVLLALVSFPSLWPPGFAGGFLALLAVLYGVMMFASSYVEEEQHFWYWLTPAWLVLLAVRTLSSLLEEPRSSVPPWRLSVPAVVIPIMLLHRLSTRWNQTGQKHAGEPDIVHTFFPDYHIVMWLAVLATYATNGYQVARISLGGLLPPEWAALVAAAVVLPTVVFKLNFTQADAPELVQGLAEGIRAWSAPFDLVSQARVAFALLGLVLLLVSALSFRGLRTDKARSGPMQLSAARLHPLLTLFLITQSRTPNIPLFLLMEAQGALFSLILRDKRSQQRSNNTLSPTPSRHDGALDVAVSALLLSHTTFFCFGGSNSISSLDLSNAYNGVADYNILAVGVLLYAGNWAGPVWWCSYASTSLLPLLARPGRRLEEVPTQSNPRAWVDRERRKLHADAVAQFSRTPDGWNGGKADASEGSEHEDAEVWRAYITATTLFTASALLAVMAACTALRTHLFIWTVFSPKYLYAMAWAVGWQLIVNLGLGGLLWSLGGMGA